MISQHSAGMGIEKQPGLGAALSTVSGSAFEYTPTNLLHGTPCSDRDLSAERNNRAKAVLLHLTPCMGGNRPLAWGPETAACEEPARGEAEWALNSEQSALSPVLPAGMGGMGSRNSQGADSSGGGGWGSGSEGEGVFEFKRRTTAGCRPTANLGGGTPCLDAATPNFAPLALTPPCAPFAAPLTFLEQAVSSGGGGGGGGVPWEGLLSPVPAHHTCAMPQIQMCASPDSCGTKPRGRAHTPAPQV